MLEQMVEKEYQEFRKKEGIKSLTKIEKELNTLRGTLGAAFNAAASVEYGLEEEDYQEFNMFDLGFKQLESFFREKREDIENYNEMNMLKELIEKFKSGEIEILKAMGIEMDQDDIKKIINIVTPLWFSDIKLDNESLSQMSGGKVSIGTTEKGKSVSIYDSFSGYAKLLKKEVLKDLENFGFKSPVVYSDKMNMLIQSLIIEHNELLPIVFELEQNGWETSLRKIASEHPHYEEEELWNKLNKYDFTKKEIKDIVYEGKEELYVTVVGSIVDNISASELEPFLKEKRKEHDYRVSSPEYAEKAISGIILSPEFIGRQMLKEMNEKN